MAYRMILSSIGIAVRILDTRFLDVGLNEVALLDHPLGGLLCVSTVFKIREMWRYRRTDYVETIHWTHGDTCGPL